MLTLALKEWSIVCDLMTQGRCCLLLRKGGVHEEGGPGRFRLEHDRFAFFPAREHENLDWIKPQFLIRDTPIEEEPQSISLKGYGEAARIWEVPSRRAFDALDELHPWTHEQIDMRFSYKPDRPLYLLAVRAYRLSQPKIIPNRMRFAGCRSWVPLESEDAIEEITATPAISDADFDAVLKRVDVVFSHRYTQMDTD